MTLAVAGFGLVSPLGLTPSDHAFFVRAGAVRPRASPFRDAAGEPFTVMYAPWLGARLPLTERLAQLAGQAMRTAILPLGGAPLPRGAPLFLCAPAPRPGLSEAQLDAVAQELLAAAGASELQRFPGAAGVFGALADAASRVAQGRAEVALVVAVDSFIDLETLTLRVAQPSCPWQRPPLPPAEGAAAFLVTSAPRARVRSWPVLGTVLGAASAAGTSTDDDDSLVDGAAMTAVLRALPPGAPAGAAYGQLGTDDLRFDEWSFAIARTAPLLAMDHEAVTPEERTGETGAAAGAMALAHGLSASLHGTTSRPVAPGAPFVAWAVSRDGTRGAALGAGSAP